MTEDSSTTFENLLRLASRDLRNSFDRAGQLRHRGERGRIREERVLSFLADRLPANYSVGTGEVIDSHGRVSQQMDGIVYHSASSPKLYTEHTNDLFQPGLFFIESVAAVISVKSLLDKDAIYDTFFNIASVKLQRKHVTAESTVIAGSSEHQFGIMQPPYGVVFAYDSVSPKTLAAHIRDLYRDLVLAGESHLWSAMPELVFVLDKSLTMTPTWYGPPDEEKNEQRLQHLPMITSELECETRSTIVEFYTDFMEHVMKVPIVPVPYGLYTGPFQSGPILFAVPTLETDEVFEGSGEMRRVAGDANENNNSKDG